MKPKQHYNQFQAFDVKKSEAEIQSEIVQFLQDSGYLVVRVNSFARRVGPRFVRSYLIHDFRLFAAQHKVQVLTARSVDDVRNFLQAHPAFYDDS